VGYQLRPSSYGTESLVVISLVLVQEMHIMTGMLGGVILQAMESRELSLCDLEED
jgi:hypothetical protein